MGRMVIHLNHMIGNVLNKLNINYHGIKTGTNLKINGVLQISGHNKIEIGDNVIINSSSYFNRIGGDTRTLLVAYGNQKINIGNNVGISNSAIISHGEGITIEDFVMIGGSCKIYDTDFHSLDYVKRMEKNETDINTKPVLIKRAAFVGAHSIILKGVTIGERVIVGAGSVVTKDIPDDEIWAGNPAKFIKKVPKEKENL